MADLKWYHYVLIVLAVLVVVPFLCLCCGNVGAARLLTHGRGGTPDETGAMYEEDPPAPEEEEEGEPSQQRQRQRQHQHKPKQDRPSKTKKKPSWAS
jgi:hypothetical protein